MNHSYTTSKKHESLYFGSGIMNNKLDSEKSSTKYTYELIAFDSGDAGYGVSESPIFKFFFPGEHAPGPSYIISAFGLTVRLFFQ